MTAVIDLDNVASWPADLLAFLRARKDDLLIEREAQKAWHLSLSTYRILHAPPDRPAWDEVADLVAARSPAWDLRAFHATRLLDFGAVKREGLRSLDLEAHLHNVRRALMEAGADNSLMNALVSPDDPNFREGREGVVFFTPTRKGLNDGGCDVFFQHFGGEAIQRMAELAGDDAILAIRSLGRPAVVVANIPATGWCAFADLRLTPSLIELFLQAEAGREASDYGWDVMIERDVPPDRIEAVVSPEDPLVLA